jgi:hypothetical protein
MENESMHAKIGIRQAWRRWGLDKEGKMGTRFPAIKYFMWGF